MLIGKKSKLIKKLFSFCNNNEKRGINKPIPIISNIDVKVENMIIKN